MKQLKIRKEKYNYIIFKVKQDYIEPLLIYRNTILGNNNTFCNIVYAQVQVSWNKYQSCKQRIVPIKYPI